MTHEIDRSMIGASSEPFTVEVERGAIRQFAEAIGMSQPEYRRGDIAPPTFPTTFRGFAIPGVNIDLARVLHGGQEYTYTRPIVPGDVLTCVNKLVSVRDSNTRMGRVTVVVAEATGTGAAGEVVFTARTTTLLRWEA